MVTTDLWVVAVLVMLINLPFGYWRAGVRKLTIPWFLAVHAAVPLVVGLRAVYGMGWRLSTVPLVVGAYLTGQFLGGRVRAWRIDRSRQ